MKNIYEIFEEFEKAETRQQKIEVLRKNDRMTLRNVLQGAFHPAIKYNIKKAPEYKRSDSPPGLAYANLDTEFRRVYLFVEGSKKADPNLTPERREHLLIQLLETLEAKEAEVFMNMIMKNLKVKGLTQKIVEEAFPGLL